MARNPDTIAALATPAGTAALALLRVSGPQARGLGEAALQGPLPPRRATHRRYRDLAGTVRDDVVAVFAPGPQTYTGEDTLELTCHGNPFIVRLLLADLLARGCRPAQPGEFTQRAFLNGRMDLSQAEAVMDLIQARSERSLASAQQVLQGALGRHVGHLIEEVVSSLAQIEAYIDFPEEDLPPEDRAALRERLERVQAEAGRLLATEQTGRRLREGIATVILGETNAGKSSLLNQLVGRDRALVSPEPGTTRDFIEETLAAGGHALTLVDTAGLNPAASGLEQQGIDRTLERAAEADLFVVVLDATREAPRLPAGIAARITSVNTLVAWNKSDLLAPGCPPLPSPLPGVSAVSVSARTGAGLAELQVALARLADGLQETFGDERIAINVRHAHFLLAARAGLEAALAQLAGNGAYELVASELRGTLSALGEISGKVDNERMLDQLFASFCIGK